MKHNLVEGKGKNSAIKNIYQQEFFLTNFNILKRLQYGLCFEDGEPLINMFLVTNIF